MRRQNMTIKADDARRIRMEAETAEDMMQRIQKETGKEMVGAYYILEKARVALWCVQFIIAECEEYLETKEETE
jgi:uncharacterized membrane protein YcjF (UPF0283 family)